MTAVRTRVGRVGEIPPGAAVRVDLDGTPVAVFNIEGTLYAIGDTCSHEQASLSEGELEGAIVECPRHGATFDVTSGRNLGLPATRPVPRFEVIVEGEEIYVEGSPA